MSTELPVEVLVPLNRAHHKGSEIQTVVYVCRQLELAQRSAASFNHDVRNFEEEKAESHGGQGFGPERLWQYPLQEVVIAHVDEQQHKNAQSNNEAPARAPNGKFC